jgi:hypothetical protein
MNPTKRARRDDWKIENIETRIRSAIWMAKCSDKDMKKIAFDADIPERTLLHLLDDKNNVKINRNNLEIHKTRAENLYYNPLVADYFGDPKNMIRYIKHMPNTLDMLLEGFETMYQEIAEKEFINVIITRDGKNSIVKLEKCNLNSLNHHTFNIRVVRDRLFDELDIPYDDKPSEYQEADDEIVDSGKKQPENHIDRRLGTDQRSLPTGTDIVKLPSTPIDNCYSL